MIMNLYPQQQHDLRVSAPDGPFHDAQKMLIESRFPAFSSTDNQTDANADPAAFGYHMNSNHIQINSNRSISIRVANNLERRLQAWQLASTIYKQIGYAPSTSSELLYGPHDALPSTVTFLATRQGRPTGALTVVRDGPLRLPADDAFNAPIQRLRQEGRSLCEIVSLASHEKGLSGAGLMKHFCKLAFLAAYGLEGATDLLITINPRHRTFYERVMLYTPLSKPIPYGKVNGAPAILLRLDIKKAFSTFREKYKARPASKNLLAFFLHRAQDLVQWIKTNRCPMDQESLHRYFPPDQPHPPTPKTFDHHPSPKSASVPYDFNQHTLLRK